MNSLVVGRRIYLLRLCGTRTFAEKAKSSAPGLSEKPNPHEITSDYIGPPDKISNLRPYVRCIPEDETPLACSLREKRNEVESWNQGFWERHNQRFYDEKEEFIRLNKVAGNEEISADVMSKFYKYFLDKNKKLHFYYNVSWYLKNFDLLVLSAQVNVQQLWRRVRK